MENKIIMEIFANTALSLFYFCFIYIENQISQNHSLYDGYSVIRISFGKVKLVRQLKVISCLLKENFSGFLFFFFFNCSPTVWPTVLQDERLNFVLRSTQRWTGNNQVYKMMVWTQNPHICKVSFSFSRSRITGKIKL